MRLIGLHDLIEGVGKIGSEILAPGAPISSGLSMQAANELGLLPGTAVGVSMIDAHAGAEALFGCSAEGVDSDVTSKLGKEYNILACSNVKHDGPISLCYHSINMWNIQLPHESRQ